VTRRLFSGGRRRVIQGPFPDDQAEELAAQFPELTLRIEPAHREAYVDLGPGGQIDATQWQLAYEALVSWRDAQGIDDEQLSLTPEDLGVRITYLAIPPITDSSVPDCDFAVPFAYAVRGGDCDRLLPSRGLPVRG